MVCLLILTSPAVSLAGLSEDRFVPVSRNPISERQLRELAARRGDTLWGISRKVNVSVEELVAMNNLTAGSVLLEGQILKVPYRRARSHRIIPGDSLWRISAQYSVSVTELVRANPGIDPDALQTGKWVSIPASSDLTGAVRTDYPSRSMPRWYAWPVSGVISSRFGWRKRGYHKGLDIACPMNTPIRAVNSGKVVFAGTKKNYGRVVIIEHPEGNQTLYAHARTLLVRAGSKVRRGQIIARVGMTGRTTGPHVHFEIRRSGTAVNPIRYLHK